MRRRVARVLLSNHGRFDHLRDMRLETRCRMGATLKRASLMDTLAALEGIPPKTKEEFELMYANACVDMLAVVIEMSQQEKRDFTPLEEKTLDLILELAQHYKIKNLN